MRRERRWIALLGNLCGSGQDTAENPTIRADVHDADVEVIQIEFGAIFDRVKTVPDIGGVVADTLQSLRRAMIRSRGGTVMLASSITG